MAIKIIFKLKSGNFLITLKLNLKDNNMLKQHPLLPLFQKFITICKTGKRLKKNGTHIKLQTIVNYGHCQKLLIDFTAKKENELIIYEVRGNNKREHSMLKKYWSNFYRQFTDYINKKTAMIIIPVKILK